MTTQENTRVDWDNLAVRFDTFVTDRNMALAKEALRRVDLRPGMRFLDVAAGSGALSLPAAHLGAQVVATDISPRMVERLQTRARDEGLTNIQAHVMDGHALELADDSFDVAGSQFGVMLFPDLALGLSELVRVTRPGGRVVVVAFGPPPQMDFIILFMKAMQAAVPGFSGLPKDPPPLAFQVANPEKFRQELVKAGLQDAHVETIRASWSFESGKEWWDSMTSSHPLPVMLVANLTQTQRTAVQEALDHMLRERSGENRPAVLENSINIGIGTK